jgi:DNA-binding transcriptional regulator YhcF (GntR family)
MSVASGVDFSRLVLRKDMPAHRQVAAYLKAVIALGQAAPGDPLPAPAALASRIRTGPAEVRKAYAELAVRGFLEGSGARWRVADGHGAVDARGAEELCERLWELVAEARRLGFSRTELQRVFNRLLDHA